MEEQFNGGFFALPVWEAYIWRSLYIEGLIFGILRYASRIRIFLKLFKIPFTRIRIFLKLFKIPFTRIRIFLKLFKIPFTRIRIFLKLFKIPFTRIRIFSKLFKIPFTRIRVRKYTVSKMSGFVWTGRGLRPCNNKKGRTFRTSSLYTHIVKYSSFAHG